MPRLFSYVSQGKTEEGLAPHNRDESKQCWLAQSKRRCSKRAKKMEIQYVLIRQWHNKQLQILHSVSPVYLGFFFFYFFLLNLNSQGDTRYSVC